eukprot:SAG31_NODE_11135_length_1062_cov_1.230530_2_plen_232_part_00
MRETGLDSVKLYLADRPYQRHDATPLVWARQGRGSLKTIFECDQILWMLRLKRLLLPVEEIAAENESELKPPDPGGFGHRTQPRWLKVRVSFEFRFTNSSVWEVFASCTWTRMQPVEQITVQVFSGRDTPASSSPPPASGQLPALRHGRRWLHGASAIATYVQQCFDPALGWPGPAMAAPKQWNGVPVDAPHEVGTLFPTAVRLMYTPVKSGQRYARAQSEWNVSHQNANA